MDEVTLSHILMSKTVYDIPQLFNFCNKISTHIVEIMFPHSLKMIQYLIFLARKKIKLSSKCQIAS
uniref:Uncharacterized protein n=1 Tax=Solanum tuberosum TaxID=4113 RepID=M1D7W3_SOLTU